MLEENDLDRRRASKPKTQAGTEAGAPTGLSGQRRSREPQGLSDAAAMLRKEHLGPCGAPPTVDDSERTERGPTERPVLLLLLLLLRDAAQTGSRLDEGPVRSQTAVVPGEVGEARPFQLGREAGLRDLPRPSPLCGRARNQMAGWGGEKAVAAARSPPSAPRIQTRG